MAKATRVVEKCPKCGSHALDEKYDGKNVKYCCRTCGKEAIYDPTQRGTSKWIADLGKFHLYKSSNGSIFCTSQYGYIYEIDAWPGSRPVERNGRWNLEIFMWATDTWNNQKYCFRDEIYSYIPLNDELKAKWEADHMSVHGDDGKDFTFSQAITVQHWILRNIYGQEPKPAVTPSNEIDFPFWVYVLIIIVALFILIACLIQIFS